MGLDQYAYFVSKKDALDDFHFKARPTIREDFYWRKNRFLHGWMEELFHAKGGEGEFNCQPVRLKKKDLNALEKAIKNRELKDVQGFFWGNTAYTDDDAKHDLDFIEEAKRHIEGGGAVYYDSWW